MRVFRRAEEMCDQQAHDIVSSTQQFIKRVDIVITGIMCGTVSNLGKSESSAECIMDEEGSTGESFKILMIFLQSPNKPLLLLLENVKEFTQMRSKRVTKTPSGAEEPHEETDDEYAVADDGLVKEKAQSCYAQACKRFAEAGFHDFGCMDVLNSGKSGELNQRQRMYAAFAQMDCPLNLEMWRLTISMLQALTPATFS